MLEESFTRLTLFVSLALFFASLEVIKPKRQRVLTRLSRWLGNIGVLFVGTIFTRAFIPILPISAAYWANENDFGLFSKLNGPVLVEGIVTFLLLDLLIYFQHRVFHHVPILWRIHRMHHTDLDFDVTTGIRFHPIEIFLSLLIKILAVLVLGASPIVVFVFEIVLNGTSLFIHANIGLPKGMDHFLRLVLVTPDMHRVHHSIIDEETNSNFGFSLPWWDYLFRTYLAHPKKSHKNMTIGLAIFRDERSIKLGHLLIQPFVRAQSKPGEDGGQ